MYVYDGQNQLSSETIRGMNGCTCYGTYTYDMDGIRQNKTVNGNTTKYTTLDGKVVRETNGNVTTDYFYDNDGKPYKIVVKNNAATYTGYYALNQQGDVTAILDTYGNVAVSYDYNAWGRIINETGAGNIQSMNLQSYNHLKYRGYFHDAETGFYYLNSRYYDPVIGRFINADDTAVLSVDQGSLLQYNLFVYCLNNPVNRIDESGHLSISILAKGDSLVATGLTAIGVAAAVVTCGVATPVMLGVAAITMGAGALTTINGASDIGEAISGHNVVRDTVFKGNAKAYNTYSGVTATISMAGTAVCGKWISNNATRIADHQLEKIINDPNSISKYSTKRFERIANQSSWESGPTRNGNGYRAYSDGKAIRYNMNGNRFDAAHNWGNPYWVISSPLGKVKVPF